ncbi:hypothetical protein FLONG3_1725 [Fusarium longipes]|uniref:Uncharacterized protein n=1 Tax=Fusarium longipes TaxID=694270 RepID=A0A395T691_9HYPO|nr:hypothetical protein FLONG3_1725 [Fusarium longipes]
MDSERIQSTNPGRPKNRQSDDSYHRHVRAAHRVDSTFEPGPSGTFNSSDSRRHGSGLSGPSVSSQSQHGNIASFFDSERLASSAAPYDPSNRSTQSTSKGIRWPFLGSIKSQVSLSLPPSPRAGTPAEPTEVELPWRPVFLHRRILVLYAVALTVLIAGVQVALQLSERNDGLREADDASRYLWQYGTTLVFIVVAAFWNRVEFQTSAAMPWIRMLNNQIDVDKSLLLDYLSLSEPMAIIKSVRNRDWLVATPVLAGIIFKLIIIFSTAFVTPRVVTVARYESAITVQSEFSNSASGLEDIGSLPYFTLAALAANNITFPDGVTPRAAYTPFSSDVTGLIAITADVDGFIGGMECEEAQLALDSIRLLEGSSLSLNLTISKAGCSSNQAITSTRLASTENEDLSRAFLSFQSARCDGSTKDDEQRMAIMAGLLDIDVGQLKRQSKNSNRRLNGKLSSSTGFLCKPKYDITTMKVSKNFETVLSATPNAQAKNTTFEQVHPWEITRAMFRSLESEQSSGRQLLSTSLKSAYSGDIVLEVDEAMSAVLALGLREGWDLPKVESLMDKEIMRHLTENFYAQYSAIIARYAMMGPSSNSSTAVASFIGRRLVVRAAPAYLITALLVLCLFLTLATMYLVPRKGFLPRDPSTIVGMASVVAHSHPLVESLKGMGPAPNRVIRSRLEGSTYLSGAEGHEKLDSPNLGYFHIFGGKAPSTTCQPQKYDSSTWRQPIPLHGLIRLIYVLALAFIIIGFEISLRLSQRYEGLRTMDDDAAYLAWTIVPALVLLLVAMYMLSLEWWTRLLSPFSHLARQGDYDETVGLNLANALRHVAWRRALKICDIAALAAITGGLMALLMVVASAPLFDPKPIELDSSFPLRTEDFFANSLLSSTADPICTDCTNDTILASLILAGDAPYPPFTYADLNIPTLSLVEDDNNTDLIVSARLTAIRPRMSCRLYKSDEISTNLTLEVELDDGTVNPLRVDLEGESCLGDGRRDSSNAIIGARRRSPDANSILKSSGSTVFGVGQGKTRSSSQCSDWIYIWGELENLGSSDMSVGSINALACNETIEAVDVKALFHGPELLLYPDHPPVPVEHTAQDTSVAIPELDYSSLVNISSDGLLDSFFAMLNSSQFAVLDSTFGSSSADATNKTRSAILSQHGIIRAQSLNFKGRRHLSSQGTFPTANGTTIVSGVDPDQPVSQAVPIISGSKMAEKVRLHQDEIATRVFQSLVGALMILHITSWMFWRRIRLPRAPTTIASITALLVDGNLFKSLPRAAQWQPDSELEAIFRDGETPQRFEMGWDRRGRTRGRDGRAKKDEGNFGIRAFVPKDSIPEEVEMRPIPPPKPPPKPAKERVGMVRQGTAMFGADGIQRKSMLLTKGHTSNSKSKSSKSSKSSQGDKEPKHKRSISSALSGPKELVKVWWAGGS